MNSVKTEIKADLKPKRSGVFTFGSLIVSGLLMFSGALLISDNFYAAGLMLFVPGTLGALASYVLGFQSQRDQDLSNAHPIQINGQSDGSFSISADPRTDREIFLETIAAAATLMKDRKPLPEPSGLVDEDGNIDESNKEEALKIADTINQKIEVELMAFENAITKQQVLKADSLKNIPIVTPPEPG